MVACLFAAEILRVRARAAAIPLLSLCLRSSDSYASKFNFFHLQSHESAADELRRQLSRVQDDAPPLKAKGRCVEEFFFKERYLTQEVGCHPI